LTLAVPLRDLQSLEPVLDVDTQNCGGASAGTIDLRTGRCPVYCVDESLAILKDPRPEHRICAILDGGDAGPFGLICGAVEALEGDGLASVGVPPCMRTPDSPLEGLTLHGRRVLCRTTGAALARFMSAGALEPAGVERSERSHMLTELDPGMDEDCV
jgi:hypothetical protein